MERWFLRLHCAHRGVLLADARVRVLSFRCPAEARDALRQTAHAMLSLPDYSGSGCPPPEVVDNTSPSFGGVDWGANGAPAPPALEELLSFQGVVLDRPRAAAPPRAPLS